MTWLTSLDDEILHWVTCKLYAPWLDPILLNAQEKRFAIPLTIGALFLLALFKPRRALRAAMACAFGFGLAMLLASILWATIARPRPPAVHVEHLTTKAQLAHCDLRPDALPVRKSISTSPSFPSRHALTAGVFAAVLLLAARPLGVLAAVYALLTVVGRVYGAKHWPSDVLAGAGLGLFLGWVAWRLAPHLVARLPRGPFLVETAPVAKREAT